MIDAWLSNELELTLKVVLANLLLSMLLCNFELSRVKRVLRWNQKPALDIDVSYGQLFFLKFL